MPFLYYPNELDPKYQALGSKLSAIGAEPILRRS